MMPDRLSTWLGMQLAVNGGAAPPLPLAPLSSAHASSAVVLRCQQAVLQLFDVARDKALRHVQVVPRNNMMRLRSPAFSPLPPAPTSGTPPAPSHTNGQPTGARKGTGSFQSEAASVAPPAVWVSHVSLSPSGCTLVTVEVRQA